MSGLEFHLYQLDYLRKNVLKESSSSGMSYAELTAQDICYIYKGIKQIVAAGVFLRDN